MMDVVLAKLDRISGDSVKLALWLSTYGDRTKMLAGLGADSVSVLASAEWVAEVSKKISIPPAVVRKCLAELVNHGALERAGRSKFVSITGSISHPCRSFARSPEAERSEADGPGEDEVEPPPWGADGEADRRDPRSGATRSARGRSAIETGSGMRNSALSSDARARQSARVARSSQLFCSVCGEERECDDRGYEVARCSCEAPFVHAHKCVIDSVVRMYADCYDGAKLTVDGRVGAMVKRLLAVHAPAEIVRRARFMFYEKRRWPAPPYHFGTLSVHFDSFIPMKKSAGGMADRDAKKTGANYYGKVDDV